MKALVLHAYNDLRIEETPNPVAGPNEVLVAIRACGICGSDIHGMDGSTGRRQPPIVMGHEAAGEIAAVGADVRDWHVGDRVTSDSTASCGECDFCRRGQINLCDRRRVFGVSCGDYRQHGAFAPFLCVPQHILYRVPKSLPFEHAAFVEPLSVAVHAVGRTDVHADDTAVVIGAGVIGLLTMQVLRARGCQRIVAVDVDNSRLDVARRCGADLVLNSATEDVLARVSEYTTGAGPRVVFEAVGIDATVDTAVRCAAKGGAVVLIGNVAPRVGMALQTVVTRELSLLGSCASAGEYPACLELMASGAVDVAPLISAVAPLADGPEWFRRLHDREPGLLKVILTPGNDA